MVNDGAASEKALTDALTEKFRCRVENGGEGRFRLAEAERNIRRQFGEEAFDRLPRTNPARGPCLGGLLHYLYETQKTDLSHINDLDYYEQGPVYGAGPDGPAQPGADRDPSGQGEAGEPAVGAGPDQDRHGRTAAAQLAGKAPAEPGGDREAAGGGSGTWWTTWWPGRRSPAV